MIHLVTLNPALDLFLGLREPSSGKIGEVTDARLEAGGKALNVARFLKKWGIPARTWLGTGGGDDPTHRLYASLLASEGLFARFLGSKAPIRVNAVIQGPKGTRKYNHPGFEMDLDDFAGLRGSVRKGDFLVLTGRLPAGMNPKLYNAWTRLFAPRGVRVIVDTSGKALLETLGAKPWFFKVNLHELSEALGRRVPTLKAFRALKQRLLDPMGLDHGALTDGGEGALVWKGPEILWVRASRPIRNRFVVGAGDAFLAGYLKGLETGKGFKECCRLAGAAGSAVARNGIQGFKPGLVARELKGVKVNPTTD